MTRIVIAAPSAVVRAGLEALLSATPGWEVAGSFADASHVEALRPDVLVAALPVGELKYVPAPSVLIAPSARRVAGWMRCAASPHVIIEGRDAGNREP